MISHVRKWGNSLAVRIPREFAAEAGLEDGTPVDLKLRQGEVRLRPVKPAEYVLEDLLQGITPDNLHREVVWGPRVGREAW
jgi:antitoxin MazE